MEKSIETTNGIYKGKLIEKNKLPKSAVLIGCGYLKLEGLYNFDPFVQVSWYATNKQRFLIQVINK